MKFGVGVVFKLLTHNGEFCDSNTSLKVISELSTHIFQMCWSVSVKFTVKSPSNALKQLQVSRKLAQ
jgi:hypothetical protein